MIFEIIASDFSIKSETPIRRTFFPLKRSSPSILISFDKITQTAINLGADYYTNIQHDKLIKRNLRSLVYGKP